ncbi:MAG: hypothetical protein FJX76_20580, partial [Armatimonadetes bacterium]|nr:hypothetical protein [Armatimonadota bacterium]
MPVIGTISVPQPPARRPAPAAPGPRIPSWPDVVEIAPPKPDFWAQAARAGILAGGPACGTPVGQALGAAAVQALADDLLGRGVRFYHSEFRGSGGSHSRLFPNEVVKALSDGTAETMADGLTIQVTGMDEFIPVKTLDDLRVVDVLHGTAAPASVLERDLRDLARALTFREGENVFPRAVGPYGVYQEFKQGPSPFQTERGEVTSAADVHALNFFENRGDDTGLPDRERAHLLRDLERDGVTFQTGKAHRALSAYEVWNRPQPDVWMGVCGTAWEETDGTFALSPRLATLRGVYRTFTDAGVPQDETTTMVRAVADGAPVERLSALRDAEAAWGREDGTPATRAVADFAWLGPRPGTLADFCGLLGRLPQSDARAVIENGSPDVRRLSLLLGRHAPAVEAAQFTPEAQRLLEQAVALESSLTPAGPPLARSEAIARHAVEDVRIAQQHCLEGMSLEESFGLLSDVHRSLAFRVGWDERAKAFAFALGDLRSGALQGRSPRQALDDLIAVFVLCGDLEQARNRLVESSRPQT